MPYSPLSAAAVQRGWAPQVIGKPIVCLKTVGSTNDWVKTAQAEGAPDGLVVFAEEQTRGRGQAGHQWLGPPGGSILASVLLRPLIAPDRLAFLTMLAACAAAGAVIEVAGLPVQLKWPNDLISEGGKLGGVLVESSTESGRVESAILGIGINVNLTRAQLAAIPGATSVRAELGHPINRNLLARALLRGLDERYALLRDGEAEAIFAEWRERLATLGKWVNLQVGERLEGPLFASQVTERGELILLNPDGTPRPVLAGEVSVRPAPTNL
jgi:BirA family biotin operon repressor/biotin-[acetyl-CoA-carboxylase] ligase